MRRILALVFACAALATAPAGAQVDSVGAWTADLEAGSLPQKVVAASKLAALEPSEWPRETLRVAVGALQELEALGPTSPGVDELGDEDLAAYHVNLTILAAAANDPTADMALLGSLSVSLGVRRIVAQLGDLAIDSLAAMIAAGRERTAALETLGLSWFWADSVGRDLSPQSRATIVDVFLTATESEDFFLRLGVSIALGNTADPSLLPLARTFMERMSIEEPNLVGFVRVDAILPLEPRHANATPLERVEGTERLREAACQGASGDLSSACARIGAALRDALAALAVEDLADAADALDAARAVADAARQAGTMSRSLHALLSGGAMQALPR